MQKFEFHANDFGLKIFNCLHLIGFFVPESFEALLLFKTKNRV